MAINKLTQVEQRADAGESINEMRLTVFDELRRARSPGEARKQASVKSRCHSVQL